MRHTIKLTIAAIVFTGGFFATSCRTIPFRCEPNGNGMICQCRANGLLCSHAGYPDCQECPPCP